jgi:hypothetical protein
VSLSAGDVFLDVHPNLSSFNRELGTRLTGLRGSLDSVLKPLGLSMGTVLGAGIGIAAAAGIKQAVDAASDLGEAVNASRETFGATSAEIEEFGATAASAFGLSKTAAIQGSIGFGAMFQSAGLANEAAAEMSTTMVGLAGDLASFRNEDPSAMLDRLRSGLAGESEPLRRFGIFLSEAAVQSKALEIGIAAAGEELTDAQKIQARYAIILEQSTKAQGDFARTLGESLPNQMRAFNAELENLLADLGEAFLPILTEIMQVIRGLLPLLTLAAENLDLIAIALGGILLAKAAPTILFNIALALEAIGSSTAAGTLTTIAAKAQALGAAATGPTLLAGAAIAVGAAYDAANKGIEDFGNELGNLQTAASTVGETVVKTAQGVEILHLRTSEAEDTLRGLVAQGDRMQGLADAYAAAGAQAPGMADLADETKRTARETERLVAKRAALEEFRNSVVASFDAAAGSLQDFAKENGLSSAEAVRGMQAMAREAQRMGRDIRALDREGVPREFRNFLLQEGPEAVRAFVRGTEQEKGKFERAWRAYRDATEMNVNAISRITRPGGTEAGRALVEGFADGIDVLGPRAWAAARELARETIAALEDELGSESPSKEGARVGATIVQGLIVGIEREFGDLRNALDEVVNVLREAISEGMPQAHLDLARELSGIVAERQRFFDRLIEQASRHLEELRDRVREFREGIEEGFADAGDLISGLMQALEEAGREGGAFGETQIRGFLQDQLARMQAFASGLQQLSALGLGPAALAELAQQGPDALPLIQALIAGGDDLIAQFNEAAETIGDIAGETADELSRAAFGEALQEAADRLLGLRDRLDEVMAHLQSRVERLIEGIRADALARRVDGVEEALRRLERVLGSFEIDGGGGNGNGNGANSRAPVTVNVTVQSAGVVGVTEQQIVRDVTESVRRELIHLAGRTGSTGIV